jgi:hypothetical protein
VGARRAASARPDQAQVVARRKIFQQAAAQHRRFLRAHQVMHARARAHRRPAADAVMGGQRIDVIGHARAGRDLRVIGACGVCRLYRTAWLKKCACPGSSMPKSAADHHDPLMRPIGLVGREEIDVAAQRRDIGKAVRRIADAIDAGEAPLRRGPWR